MLAGPAAAAPPVAAMALFSLGFAGCLPGDTRPPPAVVHLTVEPSAAVTEGFTTVDGWHVAFERFLISLGGARLDAFGLGGEDADDSACKSYAGAGYERLFDLVVGSPQKLSDIHGLGSCGVRLRLRAPGSDALLGKGVTAQDLAFMRAPGTDEIVSNAPRTVHVRGLASRDATTIHFDWSFRLDLTLHGCRGADGQGFTSDVVLIGGEVVDLPVVIHGEALFREGRTDESPLRFDALAAADADGDHAITLTELAAAPGPLPGVDAGKGPLDGGVRRWCSSSTKSCSRG